MEGIGAQLMPKDVRNGRATVGGLALQIDADV